MNGPKELIKQDGVEIARYGDDIGTPKTAARSTEAVTIEKVGKQTERRRVRKVPDLLDSWHEKGTITYGQYEAGRRFQAQAQRAQLTAGPSGGMDRVSSSPGPVRLQDHVLDATRQMNKTMQVLGGHTSPAASAMWFCVGCDFSISDTARRVMWSGRPCTTGAIRGMLKSGLAVLQSHWRMA